LEEWEETEEVRFLLEEEEELRMQEQAWEEAKSTFDDEEEIYNEYYDEYNMWNQLMMAEQDLDLWREYQKGANEAWTRVEEQEYWYQLALDEWQYQDGVNEARMQQEQADRAAGARQEAQDYRQGVIMFYESELEGIEENIYGIEEEIETSQGIYNGMTADQEG
jgi:hypothetical protein